MPQLVPDRIDILKTALNVHMTVMGSYERSDDLQQRDIEALRGRLLKWEPSLSLPGHGSAKFDNACRSIVEAALEEAAYHNDSE